MPVIFSNRKVSLPFNFIRSKFNRIPIQKRDFVQKRGKTIFFLRHRDCLWLEARNYFCLSSFQKGNKLLTSTVRALLFIGLPRDRKQGWKKGKAVKLQGMVGLICNALLPTQQCSRARWELDSSLFPGHHLAEPQDFSCHLASVPVSSCSTTQVLRLSFSPPWIFHGDFKVYCRKLDISIKENTLSGIRSIFSVSVQEVLLQSWQSLVENYFPERIQTLFL